MKTARVAIAVVVLALAGRVAAQVSECAQVFGRCIDANTDTCIQETTVTDFCCRELADLANCIEQGTSSCTGEEGVRLLEQLNGILTNAREQCDTLTPANEVGTLFPNVDAPFVSVSQQCLDAIKACKADNDVEGMCENAIGAEDCCNAANDRDVCFRSLSQSVCDAAWRAAYANRRPSILEEIARLCMAPSGTPLPTATAEPQEPRELRECRTAAERCLEEAENLSACEDLGDDCCPVSRAYSTCLEDVVESQCSSFRDSFQDDFARAQLYADQSCDVNNDFDPCFPADATVVLEHGSTKTMAELQIGDRVLVEGSVFADVYFFSHRVPAPRKFRFVSLTSASGSKVTLSPSHYLYANGKLSAAGAVKVGDAIELANGETSEVSSVEFVVAAGLYNPHTLSGDLVVDGVRTSTYTTAVHPMVAHTLLWPVRVLYQMGIRPPRLLDNDFPSAVTRTLLPQGDDSAELLR
mmetsp:Transcript_48388/g.118457  ORF Transcript_48388/g.118457 Transcript_48388/m.118457 type:complete len:469 (+) Transcript_48388:356-1762(+)